MAEVNDMFSKVTEEQSFFNPKKKSKFTPVAKGEYFGHIIDVDTKILDVKGGKYKARLYSFTVEASEENKDKTFEFENIKGELEETKGDSYVGMKFRGRLWRFLEPQKGDTFESNSEGNKSYFYFCQAIGLDCKDVTKKIDGEEVTFKELPNLTTQHMEGQPVIAVCDYGKPYTNKDGKEVTPFQVKWVKEWPKGRILENDESIPF